MIWFHQRIELDIYLNNPLDSMDFKEFTLIEPNKKKFRKKMAKI